MSMMCKMNESCSESKGMCIHEKMMVSFMMIGVLLSIGHWGLHLF